MVKLGPNTYPGWRKGSVPSVEEWQLLFSQKLDSDRVMEEFAEALQSATPQQVSALLNILVPQVTGQITNDGSVVTDDALEKKLSSYQLAGNYQPAGNYQVAGDYATNAALQQETQRAQAAEAELLPLTGGQMRGEITTSIGGIVPQVIGMNGNIVMQVWNMQIPSSAGWYFVTFPQAYMPGSVPFVFFSVDYEQNTGHNVARIVNTDANTFSNKGISVFVEDNGYQGTSSNGATYKLNCLAMGTMT